MQHGMGLFYILYITVQVSLWIVWQFNVIGESRSVPLLSNIYCDVCYEAQFHYTLGYFRIFYGRWSLNHYVRIFFINIYYKLPYFTSWFSQYLSSNISKLFTVFACTNSCEKSFHMSVTLFLKLCFLKFCLQFPFYIFFTMSSGLICPTHFKNLSVTSLSEIPFIILNVSIISPLNLWYFSVGLFELFQSVSVTQLFQWWYLFCCSSLHIFY